MTVSGHYNEHIAAHPEPVAGAIPLTYFSNDA
jgi:hypothetical protein